jgi:hypothetical protein
MVDLTPHGVSFALLQWQLLAGEMSRSAFLDRASPLGFQTTRTRTRPQVVSIITQQHFQAGCTLQVAKRFSSFS